MFGTDVGQRVDGVTVCIESGKFHLPVSEDAEVFVACRLRTQKQIHMRVRAGYEAADVDLGTVQSH